jgi:hypothetical protein
VARWLRTDDGAPAELRGFDPLDWGPGDEGVDRWKHACLEYLNEHPDKALPFGEYGDQLSVLRAALRLKGAYDAPRGTWAPIGPVIGSP